MNSALLDKRKEVSSFRKELDGFFLRLMFAKPVSVRESLPIEGASDRVKPSRVILGNDDVPIEAFDGCHFLTDSAGGKDGVFIDGKPSDIDNRLDIKIAQYLDNKDLKLTSVALTKPVRGSRVLSERVADVQSVYIHPSDRMERYRLQFSYLGHKNGVGRWGGLAWSAFHLGQGAFAGGSVPEYDESISGLINAAIGLQFNLRYQWSVFIGLGSLPAIRFITDPHGVRGIFKFREISNDETRRAALVHWVQEHWRQTGRGNSDPRMIEAYLRGKTRFEWNGMRCFIQPSDYDLEQYQKGKKL